MDRCRVGPMTVLCLCTTGQMLRALTSLGGTFALDIDVAPLPVLLQRAALLVAATAVVALEGLLYCERQKLQKITEKSPTHAHTEKKKE